MHEYKLFLGLQNARGPIDYPDVLRWTKDNVGAHFDGFTVLLAEGFWLGTSEETVVLVIVAPDTLATRDAIAGIARQYVGDFAQEAVLVTKTATETTLVTRSQALSHDPLWAKDADAAAARRAAVNRPWGDR